MTTQTPAGWYPDPYGSPNLRWWDGNQWTDATHALESPPQPGPATGPQQGFGTGPHSGPQHNPQQGPPTGPQQAPQTGPQSGSQFGPGQPGGPQGPGAPPPFSGGQSPYGGGSYGAAPPPQGPPQGPAQGGTQIYSHGEQDFATNRVPPAPGTGPWSQPWNPQHGTTVQLPSPDFGQPGGGRPPRRKVWPWIAAGGVVALVIAIIAVIVVVNNGAGRPVANESPAPVETSAPETTPTPVEPTPTPTPTATELPQPRNGEIVDPGSGFTYSVPGGDWAVPEELNDPGNPNQQQWSSGVQAMSQENYEAEKDWVGNIYAAELHPAFPYTGPDGIGKTTETVAAFYLKNFYEPPHKTKILRNKALEVGGKKGWVVEFELDFTEQSKRQNWKWNKERGAVVLVDRENGKPPSLLYMSVPDNLDTSVVEKVLDSLKIS
ncbi:DUF2510 domain-containing protein [Spongiactinospora sp. TRM90649]|uniref:DUF2510 domain-containing protein n=1 Tax=Spongiactinospora sp. TRM90649 TaxID=3031114 RepID=UPI0023F70DA4|nr:DUF2510 domain-containing protein [Spongiactinospora sp. TRM90649]MDF5757245.1 DUF2510 domain-containing protein [Spongiactinospora sp. TRM90649]